MINNINKSSIKIEFINFVESKGSISYPMGLIFISAYLKKYGFDNITYSDYICEIRNSERKKEEKAVLNQYSIYSNLEDSFYSNLDDIDPNLIFLGPVTSMYLFELINLVPKLRERYHDAILITGGPHFGKEISMDFEFINDHCKEIDVIIIGEGEETTLEFLELYYSEYQKNEGNISKNILLQKIKNIKGTLTKDYVYKKREIMNLDKLPLPDMDLLDEYWSNDNKIKFYNYSLCERRNPTVGLDEGYFQGDDDWGNYFEDIFYFDDFMKRDTKFPFGIITGSRGCPYKCNFCCSSEERRLHKPTYIFNQMVDLNKRFGIQVFTFFDPLFMTSYKNELDRIDELCDLTLRAEFDFRYLIENTADCISVI